MHDTCVNGENGMQPNSKQTFAIFHLHRYTEVLLHSIETVSRIPNVK